MKEYLSYGAGVNSTALMLHLLDQGWEGEIVFVDHGGDHPDTYQYIYYLISLGYQITIIYPNVEGYCSLPQYCLEKKILPNARIRWCTGEFKINPITQYIQTPAIQYIGISKDEERRAKRFHKRVKDCDYRFPLIEQNMTRSDCIQLIKDHGLPIPRRSGCWFCPMKPKSEIRNMMLNEPKLYSQLKAMEENTQGYTLYQNKTIPEIAEEKPHHYNQA